LARLYIFLPSEKGGDLSVSQQKKRLRTHWHKMAQTRQFFVPAQILRGGSLLYPFHCLLLQSAASAHCRGRAGYPGTSTRLRREERGGRLATGCCRRANAVASASLESYSSSSSLRPHLLSLPWSLSAAAPPPLAAIVIVLLIVGSSVPSMPRRRCHIRRSRRCGPIFVPNSPLPLPIVAFEPPSSSASLPPGKWVRGRWRGCLPRQTTAKATRRSSFLFMMSQSGYKFGGERLLARKKMGIRQKTAQNGTYRHKTAQKWAQIFVLDKFGGGMLSCLLFLRVCLHRANNMMNEHSYYCARMLHRTMKEAFRPTIFIHNVKHNSKAKYASFSTERSQATTANKVAKIPLPTCYGRLLLILDHEPSI